MPYRALERQLRYEPCVSPGGRFRDLTTGRFVSRRSVLDAMDARIEEGKRWAGNLTEALLAGRVSIAEWEAGMAAYVKALHLTAGGLAAGGRAGIGPWRGIVEAQVEEQYGYLRKFAAELDAEPDREKWRGIVRGRPLMYVNSARSSFWAVSDALTEECAEARGLIVEEKWDAAGDARTCGPCASNDAAGWQPLGTFPEPGSGQVCEGLTSCRCQKRSRWVDPKTRRVVRTE